MTDLNPNTTEEFSLADLAGIDISQVAEVRFEQLPAGLYLFEVTDATMKQGEDKDGAKRFEVTFEHKVLEVKAMIEAGVDKESLVGKSHSERFFVNPGKEQEEILKALGRIRAYITDIGGDSIGQLGAAVENTKGLRFPAKITVRKDKDDPSTTYARIKLDSKAKK